MEGHASQPSERIPAIQEYFARWTAQIHPVKSPEAEFQERIKMAQDSFNSLTHSSQNSFDKFDEIMSCGDRIKELMALHKDTKEQKEREYQQRLWEQQVASFNEHLDLFGPELGKQLYTIPGDVDTHQPDDTTASGFAPTHSPLAQPTSTDDPVPSPPNAENAFELTGHANELQRIEHDTSSGPQKRPIDSNKSPESRPTRPTKRVRSDVTQGPLTDRTIDFDQVYQNGQAEPKYNIVEHDGFWYILECNKHRLHFNNHPIRGAQKHLRGKKHNQTSVNYEGAIRALGTRVLNCTDEKVAENNEAARRPSYSQMGRPVNSIAPPVAHSLPTRSNQNRTEIDPQPGEVYTTFWSDTKKFFAILVLPWRNVGHLGKDLSLTVKDTELIKKVPSCYRYNHVDESYEWAPHYRPGGQSYLKRKYPIMYFDAEVFPGKCRVYWVAAHEFQLYDPRVTTIPFKDIVDGYIASRNSSNDQAVPHIDGGQGNLSDDRPTAEIFPRQEQSTDIPGREIIVIDDESDDETGGGELWPDTPVGTPIPKTEPQEVPMTMGGAQQDSGTNDGNASPQQPLVAEVVNHSQRRVNEDGDSHGDLIGSAEFLRRLHRQTDSILPNPGHARQCDDMPESPVPTGTASSNPLINMQPPAPPGANATLFQWPPTLSVGEHEATPIDNLNFHSHHLPQPATTNTRAPEAIMTPLSHDLNPPDASQSQPAQATELYDYFDQARSRSSQCRIDSNGRLKWTTPKTTARMARK
ncbi:uncharacterized protein FSUBG_11930 [Fusarium subglutinans]|uniref:Uncharacterized protein n=1 Tax=Gibberella subglutinans TaxID=42677 RepID=A0A8H5LAX4_GIBSU|nr:uncharacterized protein FSUBG_11930 [Fusarium subglutinans]KAF5587000.1 hypothetical protein FSUBG_11930 [Fusarium subglutinans]